MYRSSDSINNTMPLTTDKTIELAARYFDGSSLGGCGSRRLAVSCRPHDVASSRKKGPILAHLAETNTEPTRGLGGRAGGAGVSASASAAGRASHVAEHRLGSRRAFHSDRRRRWRAIERTGRFPPGKVLALVSGLTSGLGRCDGLDTSANPTPCFWENDWRGSGARADRPLDYRRRRFARRLRRRCKPHDRGASRLLPARRRARQGRSSTRLKGWLTLHNAAVMTVLFLVLGVDLIAKGLAPLTA